MKIPGRSKFRKKETLAKAIEEFKNKPPEKISRSELEDMPATQVREFAKKNKIFGWTKTRTKSDLIDLIESQLKLPVEKPNPTPRKKTKPIPAPRMILNKPNPEISVPILVPEKRPIEAPKNQERIEKKNS